MDSVGYPAKSTRISCAVMVMSVAWRKASTSNWPLGANFMRFSEARLQAESSRNMYSEQGLLALIRAVFLEVCHLLMVVSHCMPGSQQRQVASAMRPSRSRARKRSMDLLSFTLRVKNSSSLSTACIKVSVTRTELLAFWKKMEE